MKTETRYSIARIAIATLLIAAALLVGLFYTFQCYRAQEKYEAQVSRPKASDGVYGGYSYTVLMFDGEAVLIPLRSRTAHFISSITLHMEDITNGKN